MAKAEMESRRKRRKMALPQPHDWRTTDADEINKRRWRAQTESPRVVRLDRRHPVFSNFRVGSNSGMSYDVEIRSLSNRLFSCACVDFRINGLGTCKHVEATLLYLEARYPRLFRRALKSESTLIGVMNRAPEPAHLADALKAPISLCWREALPTISAYVETPASATSEVAKTLQRMADSMPL
jgi:hypothetical protein